MGDKHTQSVHLKSSDCHVQFLYFKKLNTYFEPGHKSTREAELTTNKQTGSTFTHTWQFELPVRGESGYQYYTRGPVHFTVDTSAEIKHSTGWIKEYPVQLLYSRIRLHRDRQAQEFESGWLCKFPLSILHWSINNVLVDGTERLCELAVTIPLTDHLSLKPAPW